MTLTKLIEKFLDDYCVKVADDEDQATTDLYMDDHDCIEYKNQLYYIAENNSSYTEDDELLHEMLVSKFEL